MLCAPFFSVLACVYQCVLVQLWFLYPFSPSSSSLFSLPCVCECRTIGCTGGPSTSPLPSVRFHYKQCWRWVERVCVRARARWCWWGSPLDICGLIWTGGWDTSPCRVPPRSSEASPRDRPRGDCQFEIIFLNYFFIYLFWGAEEGGDGLACTINSVSLESHQKYFFFSNKKVQPRKTQLKTCPCFLFFVVSCVWLKSHISPPEESKSLMVMSCCTSWQKQSHLSIIPVITTLTPSNVSLIYHRCTRLNNLSKHKHFF